MQPTMINFKLTGGSHQSFELAYEPNKTVSEYIDDLAQLFDAQPEQFKLVFKGKILTWKQTASQMKLEGGTCMVVLNQTKKQPKKVIPSKDQVVKGAGMSTGLGASSPFGVGGYQMINHPQYMSAISSAVDPDKMQEMLDDPQTQGMIEQMMEDPDTLRQMMEQNPMLRGMKDNPAMKMVLNNPALMKSMFNKDNLKKASKAMKDGGVDPEQMTKNMMGGNSGGFMPPGNGMPMMGLGANQGMNGQSGFGSFGGFGNSINPYLMPQMPNQVPQPNSSQSANQSTGQQPPLNGAPTLQDMMQKSFFQQSYAPQLKQLEQYGFANRERNLQVLRQTKGDVDLAIQKLFAQQ